MSQLGEMLLGLVVVLVVIFALARLLQRMNLVQNGGSAQMKVIGGLNLGSRERVLLLQVADKHILLGVTSQSISRLHTFDELPEGELDTIAGDPGVAGAFSRILGQARAGRS